MAKLAITHPLAGVAPVFSTTFFAAPRPYLTVLEMYGDAARLAETVAHILPTEPNHSVTDGAWRALWLQPGGWLLVSENAEGSCATFAAAQAAGLCRRTDVSHARTAFALSGSAVGVVLGKGSPLDLRTDRFPAGQCARTWCANFPILLDNHGEGVTLYVATPLAPALWEWLKDASAAQADDGGSITMRGD